MIDNWPPESFVPTFYWKTGFKTAINGKNWKNTALYYSFCVLSLTCTGESWAELYSYRLSSCFLFICGCFSSRYLVQLNKNNITRIRRKWESKKDNEWCRICYVIFYDLLWFTFRSIFVTSLVFSLFNPGTKLTRMWWDGGKQDGRPHQPLHYEVGLLLDPGAGAMAVMRRREKRKNKQLTIKG